MAATGAMSSATYNLNGVNGRLPVLLRWLTDAAPGARAKRLCHGFFSLY
jgi:hypothetical protein